MVILDSAASQGPLRIDEQRLAFVNYCFTGRYYLAYQELRQ